MVPQTRRKWGMTHALSVESTTTTLWERNSIRCKSALSNALLKKRKRDITILTIIGSKKLETYINNQDFEYNSKESKVNEVHFRSCHCGAEG